MTDALFKPALITFLNEQRKAVLGTLVSAIRQSERDTMREAQLAGRIEVYETLFAELEQFAKEQLAQV